jgi:hypothetical protein
MVDLALLCNLYADGPTTLGRLRELGCESLADVERIERADLEWALQASSENCERFRREARALRERVGARGVPPPAHAQRTATPFTSEVPARAAEGSTSTSGPRPVEVAPAARLASEHAASAAPDAQRHDPSADERARAGDDHTAESARPAPSSSILGVLLQAWRRASGRGGDAPARPRHESNERRVPAPRESFASEIRSEPRLEDERSGAGAALRFEAEPATRSTPSTVPADAAPTSVSAALGAARSEVPLVEITPIEAKPPARGAAGTAPTPAPTIERRSEHGTPLERIGFQGVEADYAEQLARLGVRTVEDFLAAQPLDLAGRSSMRYTVLLRMQFLARRELERVVRG